LTTRTGGPGSVRIAPAAAATIAALFALAPAGARADADSTHATLRVETVPPGLTVFVDGREAGRSPVTTSLPARTVRVRAVPADPRVFSLGPTEKWVSLTPGGTSTVTLDLRPPFTLQSVPSPASVFLGSLESGAADSLLGTTPIPLLPSLLEPALVRLSSAAYADTTIRGDSLIARAAGGSVRIDLRRVAPFGSEKSARSAPIYRRSWFPWSLIGLGAALSIASVFLHQEADDWYDQYLESSDPQEISESYDQAAHYDDLATASLVAGQAALLGGLYLIITNP
jgi:hypothetical protein